MQIEEYSHLFKGIPPHPQTHTFKWILFLLEYHSYIFYWTDSSFRFTWFYWTPVHLCSSPSITNTQRELQYMLDIILFLWGIMHTLCFTAFPCYVLHARDHLLLNNYEPDYELCSHSSSTTWTHTTSYRFSDSVPRCASWSAWQLSHYHITFNANHVPFQTKLPV